MQGQAERALRCRPPSLPEAGVSPPQQNRRTWSTKI